MPKNTPQISRVPRNDTIEIPFPEPAEQNRDGLDVLGIALSRNYYRLISRELLMPVLFIAQDVEAADAGSYGNFFIADRAWKIISISEVHRVVGTGGSVQVEKLTSGTAKDSGTDLLTTAFSLTASVNVPRFGTLTATKANLIIKRGDRLGTVISGLSGAPEDVQITVMLQSF